MRVLLAAATEAEIEPTLQALRARPDAVESPFVVGCCITGVGLMATAASLTRSLATGHWDYLISAGIGGSFSKALPLGSCVIVHSDQVADFGAEDGDDFLDVFSLGLVKANEPPYQHRLLRNPLLRPPFPIGHLQQVEGLSVTTTSGCEATIARRIARYGAAVESMEGAAVHYVCLREQVPFLQLRSISNYVTRRDRNAWRIPEAIAALNAQLIAWLLP